MPADANFFSQDHCASIRDGSKRTLAGSMSIYRDGDSNESKYFAILQPTTLSSLRVALCQIS